MHSEFYNVALDRIRYSLVWESSQTLYHGLDLQPEDHVLIITSAGCNVLNTLLKNPRQVTAIDLNHVQNKLLELKKHIIMNHPHAIFRGLLGFDGQAAVAKCWPIVEKSLPVELRGHWAGFFRSHPEGLIAAGKLEAYLNGFIHTLDNELQQKIHQLFSFDTIQAQYTYFIEALQPTTFPEQFINYFDEANLSKGRDPHLFKYAADSGGPTFYKRFLKHLQQTLLKTNFFSRFFFFGAEGLEEAILPPCYQKKNYTALRRQLHKLTIETGEAIDYLLSSNGNSINKASLSNIFEYTSQDEFKKVCQKLLGKQKSLRFIFWNLLQEQGDGSGTDLLDHNQLSADLSEQEGCFYFLNVKVKETRPVSINLYI